MHFIITVFFSPLRKIKHYINGGTIVVKNVEGKDFSKGMENVKTIKEKMINTSHFTQY